jgi:3'-5' exoribonuclease
MTIDKLELGASLDGFKCLALNVQNLVAKNGKPYLKLTIQDKTGKMEGKIWNYSTSISEAIKDGSVLQISGNIDIFAGNLQVNIASYTILHNESAEQFAAYTHLDITKTWESMVEIVSKFTEPLAKFVCEELLIKQAIVAEAFKKAPAARSVHSNWFGGLIEHTWSMLHLAGPIIEYYSAFGVTISKDKVLAGIILHDLGKIIEYDYSTPAFNYTGRGILTNHLVLGPAWIMETSNKYPDKDKIPNFKLEQTQLMHIVAAHHGTKEFGSPVLPSTIEAVIIHKLDTLDADIVHAISTIKGKAGQIPGFSDKSYTAKTSYLVPDATI